MTFPLPLVPFEQYMLAENTPEYPRVFVVEVTLIGRLRRTELEIAWNVALARHPMLAALLAKTRLGWQWIAADDLPRSIDWGNYETPLDIAGSTIDLTREPGVRLAVRADETTARVVLQFHHACSDGIGGMQFVGDLLAAYAGQVSGGAPPELPTLDPELLKARGAFGLTRPTVREWTGHATVTAKEAWRLTTREPLSVELPAPHNGAATSSTQFRGLESHTFCPQEQSELRRVASEAGGTLNDMLMCHLFGAIIDWNTAQSGQAPRGWLRINIPTNLRRAEDELMPAANVMSFTFVDRHTRDCQGSRELLESIRAETEAIKRGRLGLYFIAQLAILGAIPGGMPLVLGRRRCFATAVLSNVGDPTRAFSTQFPRRDGKLVIGDLLLENIAGTPPLRALTRVAIGVTGYAGQLTLGLLCDRHGFDQEQTRQFLDTYLARIRQGLS